LRDVAWGLARFWVNLYGDDVHESFKLIQTSFFLSNRQQSMSFRLVKALDDQGKYVELVATLALVIAHDRIPRLNGMRLEIVDGCQ
jgi:hypothetical protein